MVADITKYVLFLQKKLLLLLLLALILTYLCPHKYGKFN